MGAFAKESGRGVVRRVGGGSGGGCDGGGRVSGVRGGGLSTREEVV